MVAVEAIEGLAGTPRLWTCPVDRRPLQVHQAAWLSRSEPPLL